MQLSLHLGLDAKRRGQKQVAGKNHEFVSILREQAKLICRQKGSVCSDDLRVFADENGLKPTHPNAYGAIFNKDFIPGEFVRSKQVQRRGSMVRVWRLR